MKEMKDSGVQWVGFIPNGWNIISFSQGIMRMATGLNPRDNFELTKEDDFYYVTIRNYKNGKLFLDDNCDRISYKAWCLIQERSDLQKGDILFASISKDGQCYILEEEPINWNINESVFCIRINKNYYIEKYFYYHLINDAFYSDLRMDATGSTFQSIKQNKLRMSRMVLPPLPEQQRIADYLDRKCADIDNILEKTKSSIEEYKKLKQSVITEAVTKGIRGERQMKDSGIEWIGEIPEEWAVSRIGRHYIIILGKMLCSEPKAEDYTYEKYYCAADIHFDGISNNDYKSMWFSENEKTQYKVQIGDLLVVEGGAGAGGCAIVNESSEDFYIQNSLMIVRPKSNSSSVYLRFYIESIVKRGYIEVACNKATIPHFTKDKLSTVPVPIPSFDEQTEIASYLGQKCAEIEKLIEAKERLITELETYKKSLIYEYVTGKKEVI